MLELHAAVALFGLAGLFGKWIALPAPLIVLGRAAVAAIALGLLMAVRNERVGEPGRRLAATGALLALHWVAFFEAVQQSSVAVALLGFASFPVFVILLARAMLRQPLRVRGMAQTLLVVVGLLILADPRTASSTVLAGLAWGVAAGASFALLTVYNRALSIEHGPVRIAFWQNAVAALCLVPIPVLTNVRPSAVDLALMVVLGLVCTALAHTLFVACLRRIPAQTASVVVCLEPVYGIALAALLLHELPDVRTLAGGALIVGTALWASLSSAMGRAAPISTGAVQDRR
jgi:drug/metabolite transporter (DMT)-like permease